MRRFSCVRISTIDAVSPGQLGPVFKTPRGGSDCRRPMLSAVPDASGLEVPSPQRRKFSGFQNCPRVKTSVRTPVPRQRVPLCREGACCGSTTNVYQTSSCVHQTVLRMHYKVPKSTIRRSTSGNAKRETVVMYITSIKVPVYLCSGPSHACITSGLCRVRVVPCSQGRNATQHGRGTR